MKVLLPEDLHSACYKRLKDYYENRLAELRAKNDAQRDDESTAHLRGRIHEIKEFMRLEIPEPKIPE